MHAPLRAERHHQPVTLQVGNFEAGGLRKPCAGHSQNLDQQAKRAIAGIGGLDNAAHFAVAENDIASARCIR